jgi:hypothetical protein
MGQDFKVKNGIIINSQNLLKFAVANSSNYIAFKAPSSISASNITWTLPGADGYSNQVLATNGAGSLTWVTQTSGGGGGSGGSPNLDGGIPSSNYGGITAIDGGTP